MLAFLLPFFGFQNNKIGSLALSLSLTLWRKPFFSAGFNVVLGKFSIWNLWTWGPGSLAFSIPSSLSPFSSRCGLNINWVCSQGFRHCKIGFQCGDVKKWWSLQEVTWHLTGDHSITEGTALEKGWSTFHGTLADSPEKSYFKGAWQISRQPPVSSCDISLLHHSCCDVLILKYSL